MKNHSDVAADAAAALSESWAAGAGDAGALARALSIGRLVRLDWVLGVTTASSACKRVGAPFVSLTLRVADGASGQESVHTLELTLPEFQDFANKFASMATVMDSL